MRPCNVVIQICADTRAHTGTFDNAISSHVFRDAGKGLAGYSHVRRINPAAIDGARNPVSKHRRGGSFFPQLRVVKHLAPHAVVRLHFLQALNLLAQNFDELREQVEGLKKVQADDGMWRQVLDNPELWEETSSTAMFAYGIARAVNRGWIDPSNMAVARKAFAGIAKNVTADGVVKGTCMGTGISTDFNYYIARPHPYADMHHRIPVILAGTAIFFAA